MVNLTEKVKEKVKGAKDKVVGSDEESGYDSTKHYEANEPMSPAKIKEHEPTAVKREMTEKITQGGKRSEGTDPDEASEKARRSGMTKGTAGA